MVQLPVKEGCSSVACGAALFLLWVDNQPSQTGLALNPLVGLAPDALLAVSGTLSAFARLILKVLANEARPTGIGGEIELLDR